MCSYDPFRQLLCLSVIGKHLYLLLSSFLSNSSQQNKHPEVITVNMRGEKKSHASKLLPFIGSAYALQTQRK